VAPSFVSLLAIWNYDGMMTSSRRHCVDVLRRCNEWDSWSADNKTFKFMSIGLCHVTIVTYDPCFNTLISCHNHMCDPRFNTLISCHMCVIHVSIFDIMSHVHDPRFMLVVSLKLNVDWCKRITLTFLKLSLLFHPFFKLIFVFIVFHKIKIIQWQCSWFLYIKFIAGLSI